MQHTTERSDSRRPERRSAPPSGASAAPTDVSEKDGVAALYDLIFGDSALDARARAYDRTRRMLQDNPHAVNGVLDAVSDFLTAERGGDGR